MRLRTWVVGITLFLVFAIVFAPATLMRSLLPDDGPVDLLHARGSLWRGSGELIVEGQPLGTLLWNFRATTLLQGALGYDVDWSGADHRVSGLASLGLRNWRLELTGSLGAPMLNRWLAPYDIALGGRMDLDVVTIVAPYRLGGRGASSGTVRWNGGPVRYQLGGRDYAGDLPPLAAFLGDGLEAVVYPENGQTPLLRVEIQENGFVRIGMTRLLTLLLGNPWPGSHQDHEVVLEVEEQLF